MAGDSRTIKLPPMAVGQKYGRLTSIEFLRRDERSRAWWLFSCECGEELISRADHVRGGLTVSCGCFNAENNSTTPRATTHGMTDTPEYGIWCAMLNRCRNSNVNAYRNYGGRGISVCERWLTFKNFYADMGPRTSANHSIDRVDNDGNYEPNNVRWTTAKAQSSNRRKTLMVKFQGREMPLTEAAELAGIKYGTVHVRMRKFGFSAEQALLTPVRKRR